MFSRVLRDEKGVLLLEKYGNGKILKDFAFVKKGKKTNATVSEKKL